MAKSQLISKQVEQILRSVREKGDSAIQNLVFKFDRIRLAPQAFEVSKAEMRKAADRISPKTMAALLYAKKRIDFFHRQELRFIQKKWSAQLDGVEVGQRALPLNSVGIYVPGGRFPYPSTVLMTAIPARVAGVKKIVMVTPPGQLKDETLAAAHLAGVDQCFRVGGPAAIAALAYGTKTIPRVNKIVGPGNAYVTEAKRQVFGQVGIDGLAGPSEVAVWADASASLQNVLLNLLAQAEHGPDSISILLCTDAKLAQKARDLIPAKFKKQILLEFKKSEQQVIDRINEIAPEHLCLFVRHARNHLEKIKNAGAIFIGDNTPVPLGDYSAGPSHVLPTGASAQFSSGLSVKDFLKWNSIIQTQSSEAKTTFDAGLQIAEVEGLTHHALALKSILEDWT